MRWQIRDTRNLLLISYYCSWKVKSIKIRLFYTGSWSFNRQGSCLATASNVYWRGTPVTAETDTYVTGFDKTRLQRTELRRFHVIIVLQCSSQVTLRVRALRGMRVCEKLARAQGALEELRVKQKPLESWTIANLPARLLLRVLAQSWYSLYIKFASQNIVTYSYNISVPYTERECYAGASSRKSSHL